MVQPASPFRRRQNRLAAALIIQALVVSTVSAEGVVLKNGMQLEGIPGKVSTFGQNPLSSTGGGGQIKNQLIVVVDNGLTRTLMPTFQVQDTLDGPATQPIKIKIRQRVADRGPRVGGVGTVIRMTPWDPWGRRIVTMNTLRGPLDVVQGVTEITPLYTKVEALQGKNNLVWDMRIATNTIDRATISSVLSKNIDPKVPDDRLQVVRLYVESERYKDAREELQAIIKDFPELRDLQRQVVNLQQMSTQRLIKEIKLYREAGQHVLAHRMLTTFPDEDVAAALLLEIRDMLAEYDKARAQGQRVLDLLAKHSVAVEDAEARGRIDRARREINSELNINNLNRFADYLRLADDDKLGSERKLALAVSGWLLGPGSATENLAVAQSLIDVRDLLRKYLNSDRPHERQEILKKLEGEEGATPDYVTKIIAHMKPPREPRPKVVPPDEAPPEEAPPEGAPQPGDIYGYHEFTVPGLAGQADITYFVQLPPEYDPYRRYPAIVTLHAARTTAEQQIDWWAGQYSEKAQARLGQSSRQGYIVIAPAWTKQHQRAYEYSPREHATVLFSLRDACQRFSIDTDKVFLSGHSIGGDAVWDIGLAHPDLWAGVIPFVPTADKYVSRYWKNAKTTSWYFVTGELDGDKISRNSQDLTRYLRASGTDVMVVQYLGRGHEHFHDEIQRVFKWMSLHERNFFPDEFACETMRSWDNFFWWVELSQFPPQSAVNPYNWPPPTGTRPATVEAKIALNNRLSVRTNAGHVTLWLSPEMVNFDERVSITVVGNRMSRTELVKPSIETILEDVRTRGDRQHPFWAKVEKDTGRGGPRGVVRRP
jgi:predicted esterase